MAAGVLLLLRVVIALVFIYHGWSKVFEPSGPIGFFTGLGLPGFLAPVTGVVEVGGGLLLLFGLFARPIVSAMLVIITGALVLVQIPKGIQTSLERDILIAVSLLLLLTHGPGAFALRRNPRSGSPG
jgi:putative oxidoreductase